MKIPNLCQDCPNNIYFKKGKCWAHWKDKKECVTKYWLKEMGKEVYK